MDNAIELSNQLRQYIFDSSEPVPPAVHRVIEQTQAMDQRSMQITPEQAILMRAIVRMIRPNNILEIGTFTGLSSLVMASVLPAGARITCLDVSEEYTQLARQAWEQAGVAERIDLVLGPALDSLANLEGPYELAFIDADKGNLQPYVEAVAPMMPPGGVIMVDNTLWRQQVIQPDPSSSTLTIQRFNAWLVANPDFDVEMIGIADGLTLAIKR